MTRSAGSHIATVKYNNVEEIAANFCELHNFYIYYNGCEIEKADVYGDWEVRRGGFNISLQRDGIAGDEETT